LTLRVWASHAGDVRGSTIVESLDAYLGRLLSQEERQSAEAAALGWLEGRAGVFSDQAMRRGTPTSDLVEAGILARREGGNYSFCQPALAAYLGARAMAASGPSEAVVRGGWPPAESSVGFFAALSDTGTIVQRWIEAGRDVLETGTLDAARLLRYGSPKASWRQTVLRSLAQILQSHQRPYGLRLRAVDALVQAGEPTGHPLPPPADSKPPHRLLSASAWADCAMRSVAALVGVATTSADGRQAACLGWSDRLA
jgi:hypothetical protein